MSSQVQLWVDHRELALKDLLKNENPILEHLAIGDVSVTLNGDLFLVFERKTLSDFAASIKDGRFKNQKIKLKESLSRVFYIIEGHFDYNDTSEVCINGISKKAIISAVLNTMVRDEIQVFFTKNVADTADLMIGLFTRIRSDPAKYSSAPSTDHVILKARPKVHSKEDCYESQLCQIPDVSRKTAKAIMKAYPSWSNLYTSLTSFSDEEKLKLLKSIMIEESKRRISEKVAKNLIHYMF